ncbi:MAG: YmdB family metallophosphoesterase [Sphaerochaetaceae bacterium]|nr:YmdB family metallophosphoesterase [Sphaerochaetaceae bacterium]
MKILFLGEIVGRCGIGVIKNRLKDFRKENNVDLVIANGEGATGGYGLGFRNAITLQHMGIDVLTMGEKSFFKIDMVENIDKRDRILRPANYPETAPGRGIRFVSVGDKKVCVINMLGMCNFNNPHLNNPFLVSESLAAKAKSDTPFIVYVFHASATAEKITMGKVLQGKVGAVIGTHSKVLTADGKILDGGTAYITDIGRCGASMSVGGFEPEHEIKKYRTQIIGRSHESWERPQMQGCLVTLDDITGMATEISIVKEDVEVDMLQSDKDEA